MIVPPKQENTSQNQTSNKETKQSEVSKIKTKTSNSLEKETPQFSLPSLHINDKKISRKMDKAVAMDAVEKTIKYSQTSKLETAETAVSIQDLYTIAEKPSNHNESTQIMDDDSLIVAAKPIQKTTTTQMSNTKISMQNMETFICEGKI